MKLTQDFNAPNRQFKLIDSSTLQTYLVIAGNSHFFAYDFLSRILISTRDGGTATAPHVTPFSQLDRESLEFLREKLIGLGGTPPELPEAEDAPRKILSKAASPLR